MPIFLNKEGWTWKSMVSNRADPRTSDLDGWLTPHLLSPRTNLLTFALLSPQIPYLTNLL